MSEQANLTSLTMLDRVRANDPAAWSRFVHLYSPLVFHWCRKSGLNTEDSADLMQEVFRSVSGAVGTFRRERDESFRAWLWTITRNKLRDYSRAARQRPTATGGSSANQRMHEVPEAEPEPDDDSPSGEGPNSLLRRALEVVRGDFEGKTFQAFWQSAVDGRTAADIATDLGLSIDAVYQAKARVMRRLREELGDLLR